MMTASSAASLIVRNFSSLAQLLLVQLALRHVANNRLQHIAPLDVHSAQHHFCGHF